MLPLLLLLLGDILLLFLLSRHLLKVLNTFLFLFFRSKHAVVGIVTFIYLPGTIIHELAHLITAEVLRVKTGEISFSPSIEKRPDGMEEVRAGHVQIAHTDPFRRYLIGLAPIFFGLFFLLLLIWTFNNYYPATNNNLLKIGFTALFGYLLFAISNSMFSSRTDLEGFVIFAPIVIILVVGFFYVTGIQITLTVERSIYIINFLKTLTTGLGIVIGVNIIILLINSIILRGILKLKRASYG